MSRLATRLAKLEAAADAAMAKAAPVDKPAFRDPSFPAQVAFIDDKSRFKVMLGTRRAAKSYSIALDFLDDAWDHPNANYLYIGLTRSSAKKAIWKDGFKLIRRRLGLDLKFNESDLTCTLPNGAVIYVLGMDASEDQKEKARGGKYRKIAVDEAQSFGTDLVSLVMDVLRPATADERGSITIAGTPGAVRNGLFFDLSHDQDPQSPGQWKRTHADTAAEWSGHRWNAGVNPYMREQWEEEIASMQAINPRIVETPKFIREYLGRWVLDESNLVYRYQPGRNDYDPAKEGPTSAAFVQRRGSWHFVLVIDLGFSPDPSAFGVLAYHDADPTLYVVEADEVLRLDITDVAGRAKEYQGRYEFDALVIDGANKQAVEEMRKRHGLPLQNADKRGKADFIEMLNADFIRGAIKVNRKGCEWDTKGRPKSAPKSLPKQYEALVWDERAMRLRRREEHRACANHAADTVLYGWRHCHQYLSQAEMPTPARGSPEWYEAEEKRQVEALERRHRERESGWGQNEW